tara:strand:- start:10037 stop:10876 length:840 start_codon:yes stop_codon:yes gene_type:complete
MTYTNSNHFRNIDDSIKVHSRADVDPKAKLSSGVIVNSGAVIGPNVEIGANTIIGPNAIIQGNTIIGDDNKIFPGACIGLEPQDLKYKGAPTEIIIGKRNRIREYVTINKATNDGEKTVIGNDNLLMAYSHIGHNCVLEDGIVIANTVQIAGHVSISNNAVIGGCLGVHQFVHIGKLAMVGGMTRVVRDVPPYCLAEGHPGRLRGLNRVGIKRSADPAIDKNQIKELQEIWNLIFKSEYVISEALAIARSRQLGFMTEELCEFLESSIQSERRGPMPII